MAGIDMVMVPSDAREVPGGRQAGSRIRGDHPGSDRRRGAPDPPGQVRDGALRAADAAARAAADVGSSCRSRAGPHGRRRVGRPAQDVPGVLPIAASGSVLLSGPAADDIGRQSGGWTMTWQGGTGPVTPGTTHRGRPGRPLGDRLSYDGSAPFDAGHAGRHRDRRRRRARPTPRAAATRRRSRCHPTTWPSSPPCARGSSRLIVVVLSGRPVMLDGILDRGGRRDRRLAAGDRGRRVWRTSCSATRRSAAPRPTPGRSRPAMRPGPARRHATARSSRSGSGSTPRAGCSGRPPVRRSRHDDRHGDALIRRHRAADATVTDPRAGRPAGRSRGDRRPAEPRVQVRLHGLRARSSWPTTSSTAPPRSAPSGSRPTGSSSTTSRRCRSTGAASSRPGASPDTERLLTAARWFVERGCRVKGHPLCWHTVGADWLLDLTDDEIVDAQLARIRREVTDFAGVIDTWDVINEVVIMPIFAKYDNGISRMARKLGRVGIVQGHVRGRAGGQPRAPRCCSTTSTCPPTTSTSSRTASRPASGSTRSGSSRTCTRATGARRRPQDVLGRFARFGLPIHFTESTLVSGRLMPPEIVDLNDYQVDEWPSTPDGEARQADEIVRHYRTLLARPGRRGDHLVGAPGRRLAARADRPAPGRRNPEARLRRPARPDQGRVVAAADADGDRRRRRRSGSTASSATTRCRLARRGGDVPTRDRGRGRPSTSAWAAAEPRPG